METSSSFFSHEWRLVASNNTGRFFVLIRTLLADAEVAADGERLLLDLGLEFDLGLLFDIR